MTRIRLRNNSAWTLALLVLLGSGLTPFSAHAKFRPAAIGQVISSGKLSDVSGPSPVALKAGATLVPGEKIETGAEPAIVLLTRGKVSVALKIKPLTRIRLNAASDTGLLGTLEQGGVLSDVHNPEKIASPFSIKTRTAVMGVRGTVFYVEETPSKPLFLCVCHGNVAISGARGALEQSIESQHHDHPVMIEDTALHMTPAPMGDGHTDADAAELEKAFSR